jgi:hypothetical protein
MSSDSDQQRLIERYSKMPSEQLLEIASEPSAFTEPARAALEAEIKRRGLDPPPIESPAMAPDNSPDLKLVMVRQFRDLPEALLAKGSLDSAGVESFLADDNMVRMDWFISNLIGGVKLLVREEDFDEAANILNQPIPENFDVEGVGEYRQPHCPQCGSLDINFEELNKPIAYLSAYASLPLPVHNQGWKCHACGHSWDAPAEESPG